MKAQNWFSVDTQGLSQVLGRKTKDFLLLELIQNAWDAPQVRNVRVHLKHQRGMTTVTVEDDSPVGFVDLAHAHTLFAPSIKRGDPRLRGRFNLGEKLAIALCDTARIETTTGTVVFSQAGRQQTKATRSQGSKITCILRTTDEEFQEILKGARRLIPPAEITTWINEEVLKPRHPLQVLTGILKTEQANPAGILRRVDRKTHVSVYPVEAGEEAYLFEMGVPIVATGDKWHYNVEQKVPLTMDRESVAPSFLRDVRLLVFNQMHQLLDGEDMASAWVGEVVGAKGVQPEAICTYMRVRFTDRRVSYDPSDVEANKLAVSKGFTVVTGNMLSSNTWKNVKNAGAILPAGQVTPSPKPYSPDGKPFVFCKDVSKEMRDIQAYAQWMALSVLGANIAVEFADDPQWPFSATYGPGKLVFNVGVLGRSWFQLANLRNINQLLIHEFGHHYALDHLSAEYHEALCRIGARLVDLALQGKLPVTIAQAVSPAISS